jgi:NAD(P) transhydrogenase subunit beta
MPTLNPQLVREAHWAVAAAGFLIPFLLMYGLWRMSSPVTAFRGIRVAGAGMLLAVLVGCLYVLDVEAAANPHLSVNIVLAATALVMGAAAAWWRAKRAAWASLTQSAALWSAMGGGAAMAIAACGLFGHPAAEASTLAVTLTAVALGAACLSGSLVAWGRLGGLITYTLRLSGRPAVNGAALLAVLAMGVTILGATRGSVAPLLPMPGLIGVFMGCALLVGILMTLPVGTADMPIVVSIDCALTGVAVGLEGFVLQNPLLMIAGMLVAGAGLPMARLLAAAVNRSVGRILFRGATDFAGSLRPMLAGDAGMFMRYARKVVIVPGYGLAAAQGQQKLCEFVRRLRAVGVEVKVAIHPLAGRMPRQMEVMLAEAGLPDELMIQIADIGDHFSSADVALVIGANDIVNPAASGVKSLPIFGMPLLDAGAAQKLYVVKRGAGTGYAGIPNRAFQADNCHMIYGDAQTVLVKMVETLTETGFPIAA